MKLGAFMGIFDPLRYADFAVEAEQLGCESLWLPEHLVLPVTFAGAPGAPATVDQAPGDHPHLPSTSPLADSLMCLAHIAARTSTIRLGTCVYVPGLRHPFVVARAWQTLDLLSGGRADVGVGAGWLRAEWDATQVPFAGRGLRLDETIDVCRRLWTEEVTSFRGRVFQFDDIAFWPKPLQPNGPPIHIGGSSEAALERAARRGDGWMPMDQTPETIRASVERLRALRRACGREHLPFEITVPVMELRDLDRWHETGVVDRVLVGCRRDAELTFDAVRSAAAILC